MILLTFAFKGEALNFIKDQRFKRLSVDKPFYQGHFLGKEHLIILTGSGIYKSREMLNSFLDYWNRDNPKVHHIINLGIAGSLSSDYEKYEIVSCSKVFMAQEKESLELDLIKPHSLNLKNAIVMSTLKPILTPDDFLKTNRQEATIVDQELFSLVDIAKKNSIKISAFKLISDFPCQEETKFSLLKKEIQIFGERLFSFYEKLNL